MPEIFPADDQDTAEFFGQLLVLAEGRPDRVRVLTGSTRASAYVDDDLYERWTESLAAPVKGSDKSPTSSDTAAQEDAGGTDKSDSKSGKSTKATRR